MKVTRIGDPNGGTSDGWNRSQVRNGPFNGVNEKFFGLSMEGSGNGTATYGFDVQFTWPAAHTANGLTFSIGDIDNSPRFQDRVWVNTAPATVTRAAAVQGMGTASNPWYSNGGTQSDSGAAGNVTLKYAASTALTTLTISYRNNPAFTLDEQHVGILDLRWCSKRSDARLDAAPRLGWPAVNGEDLHHE